MEKSEPSRKLILIYLEDLDGDGFEDFCVDLFFGLGYHSVVRTPKGPDGGKDLIIARKGKTTFVECRHWKKAIGRPDIQKLHSATVSEGADHAIFVTTGRFSKPAIDCAMTLEPSMLLIDGNELAVLAEKAGFRIVRGLQPGEDVVYFFEGHELGVAKELLSKELDAMMSWNPNGFQSHSNDQSLFLYLPFYRLEYSIPSRKASGARKRRAKTYALVEATAPSLPRGVHPSAVAVLYRTELDACFGTPVRQLGVWTKHMAVIRCLPFQKFALPYEAILTFALRYGEVIAVRMNLARHRVVLRHIHRLMVPVVRQWRKTATGVVETRALFGLCPYIIGTSRHGLH